MGNGAARLAWARQEFCVNGRFLLAPQAILGGGKAGIRFVVFHFSTAHSDSSFWSFVSVLIKDIFVLAA
jgi:hypothetical protein